MLAQLTCQAAEECRHLVVLGEASWLEALILLKSGLKAKKLLRKSLPGIKARPAVDGTQQSKNAVASFGHQIFAQKSPGLKPILVLYRTQ